MNTFRTNSSLRRAAGVVILGALVLGGTFATAAAFSGRGSSGDEDPASPAPSRAPVVTPTPAPIVTPGPVVTPAPIVAGPVVEPEPVATPEPKPWPPRSLSLWPRSRPMAATTRCRSGSTSRPRTGTTSTSTSSIATACSSPPKSGHPGEGMSVEPYTLEIENLDERTLKLTWVDFGIDNALELHFFQDGRVFVMVQPEPDRRHRRDWLRPGADPHLRGADLGRRHRRLPAGRLRHAG